MEAIKVKTSAGSFLAHITDRDAYRSVHEYMEYRQTETSAAVGSGCHHQERERPETAMRLGVSSIQRDTSGSNNERMWH